MKTRLRSRPVLATWAFVTLLTAGCDGPGTFVLHHPIADSLVSGRYPTLVAPVAGDTTWPVVRRVQWDTPRTVIGALTEGEGTVIGRIATAKSSDGEVFVLDDRFNVVRVFSEDGTNRGVIGAPGAGPGEFSIPLGLAVWNHRLFVGDERGVLHEFLKRNGSWVWERDLPVEMFVLDLCAGDSGLFVLAVGEDDRRVIWRFGEDGPEFAFGVPYVTEDIFLRYMTAEGRLLCLHDGVVFVPNRLGEVHYYGMDGELRWVAKLPHYKPMLIGEYADGSVQMGLSDGRPEMHVLHATASLGEDIVVQLGVYDEEARQNQWPHRLDSYLINVTTGRTQLITGVPELPGIVGWGGGRLISFTNAPYPFLSIFGYGEVQP